MRILGLDFGDKTIGVAVSDPEGRVALGVETLRRTEPEALRAGIRRLDVLIKEYSVKTIVLGYPKNMDNTPSERCEKTLLFKEKLERNFKSIPVMLWDERLSTVAATQAYQGRRGGLRAVVDEMAATYILQGYLDHKLKEELMMQNDFDEPFDLENDDSAITMFDDEGNETKYNVLSSREAGDCMYLLVEEVINLPEDQDEDEELTAEVLHFKCISSGDEEMVFELVDEEHEDFDKVFALFKDDYEALGIEID